MLSTFAVRLSGCIAALTLAATNSPARQKDTERERVEADLKRYHAVLSAYQTGDGDSVGQILAWDPKRLGAIVAAAETPLDVFHPWPKHWFKVAAMLHTDAAIRVLDSDEPRVEFQLDVAGRLLHKGGPELHSFSREWYATATRVLRDVVLLSVAERLLERGRGRLPNDAGVLYESGVLQEQIATFAAFITETVGDIPSPRSQSGGLHNPGSTSRIIVNRNVVERRRALDSAAGWLRESIKIDPSSELAQLHLGRVQALRGNDSEASKLLQRLAASAVDADTSYLATMFLGAMHDRRRRHDEAEQMYRRAIERIPAAQSAYVALSEVLQKLGRGDESREVLIGLLRTPAGTRTEPWWWYLSDPIEEARGRTDALRASVRK